MIAEDRNAKELLRVLLKQPSRVVPLSLHKPNIAVKGILIRRREVPVLSSVRLLRAQRVKVVSLLAGLLVDLLVVRFYVVIFAVYRRRIVLQFISVSSYSYLI